MILAIATCNPRRALGRWSGRPVRGASSKAFNRTRACAIPRWRRPLIGTSHQLSTCSAQMVCGNWTTPSPTVRQQIVRKFNRHSVLEASRNLCRASVSPALGDGVELFDQFAKKNVWKCCKVSRGGLIFPHSALGSHLAPDCKSPEDQDRVVHGRIRTHDRREGTHGHPL